MAKRLEYYLVQARRIAAHREAGSERIIRKIYKHLLKDLQAFVAEAYTQYAEDDALTFAALQKAGYHARFLEEVEQRINVATPQASRELKELVEETYKLAYDGMVRGVVSQGADGLDAAFAESVAITPEQIRAAVENPVSGLTLSDTLEKHRKDIIYGIKQVVGVGLMNGDRYTTMARRIAEHVDGDYKKAIRIARTETHRVREAGNIAAAESVDEELKKTSTGLRMVKVWMTMKDERVRPQKRRKGRKGWKTSMGKGANHMKLHGQTVLTDELFDLGGGVTAKAPGQSGVAGQDINCRCYASYEMMTDAEYFAATGKHFPENEKKGTVTIERFDDYYAKDDEGNHIYEEPEKIAARWEDVDKRYAQLVDKYGVEPAICGDMALINAKQWDLAYEENLRKYMQDNPDVRKSTAVRRVKKTMYERPTGKTYDIFQCGECYDNNFWDLEQGKKVSAILLNSRSSGFEMTFQEAIEYRQNKLAKQAARVARGRRARGLSGVLEGAEGTFIHEYGHLIDHKYHISSSPKFQKLWNSLSEDEITLGLSSYAATNEKELLAEAFLESFLPDQGELSKKVMGIIEEMIK